MSDVCVGFDGVEGDRLECKLDRVGLLEFAILLYIWLSYR